MVTSSIGGIRVYYFLRTGVDVGFMLLMAYDEGWSNDGSWWKERNLHKRCFRSIKLGI